MTNQTSQGILAIWHDLKPDTELDFQEWHFRQHIIERLSVPGFLRGCRYRAVDASTEANPIPVVFNFYLTEAPETLTSDAYLERLNNPTEWTTRVMPSLQNVDRSAGRVVASVGNGQGGAIATLRVSPAENNRSQFETWFTEQAMQQIFDLSGIVAVHLWKTDSAASNVKTTESKARTNSPDKTDSTIAIEGNNIEFVRSACDWLQAQAQFNQYLNPDVKAGIYQLQHQMESQ